MDHTDHQQTCVCSDYTYHVRHFAKQLSVLDMRLAQGLHYQGELGGRESLEQRRGRAGQLVDGLEVVNACVSNRFWGVEGGYETCMRRMMMQAR